MRRHSASEGVDVGFARRRPEADADERIRPAPGRRPSRRAPRLAFMLARLEQALPAETAIPARSNWTSWLALVTPGMATAPIVGHARGAARDDHAACPAELVLQLGAKLRQARHGVGEGAASSAAAKPAAAGNRLRAAAIALLLPARGSQRRDIADQQGTDPRRPAELVRRHRDEIGVGQVDLAGALRAIGEQQRPGARGPARRCRPCGWITPVSLLTCWIATSAGSPSSAASSAAQSISPSASTGRIVGALAHRRRHDVMLGRADQPPLGLRRRGGNRDRLARARREDDVMTPAEHIGDGLARRFEQGARRRGPRHAARGVGPDFVSARPSPPRASGSSGVVAAWSR